MAAILDAILKIIAFPDVGFWGTFSMLLMISNTTQIRLKNLCVAICWGLNCRLTRLKTPLRSWCIYQYTTCRNPIEERKIKISFRALGTILWLGVLTSFKKKSKTKRSSPPSGGAAGLLLVSWHVQRRSSHQYYCLFGTFLIVLVVQQKFQGVFRRCYSTPSTHGSQGPGNLRIQ